jgi:hypothetical protein
MFFAGGNTSKPKSMQNVMQRNGEIMSMFAGLPENLKLETVILRDLKLAYGM